MQSVDFSGIDLTNLKLTNLDLTNLDLNNEESRNRLTNNLRKELNIIQESLKELSQLQLTIEQEQEKVKLAEEKRRCSELYDQLILHCNVNPKFDKVLQECDREWTPEELADVVLTKEELEAWIKTFPVKPKINGNHLVAMDVFKNFILLHTNTDWYPKLNTRRISFLIGRDSPYCWDDNYSNSYLSTSYYHFTPEEKIIKIESIFHETEGDVLREYFNEPKKIEPTRPRGIRLHLRDMEYYHEMREPCYGD
ncbi:hypothetical protein [Carp edema virus]|nr:hypothetical protein [Carp edema virus]